MKNFYVLCLLATLVGCSSYHKADDIKNISNTTHKKINDSKPEVIKLEAWGNTDWGMSLEEVKRIYEIKERDFDLYCPDGFVVNDCSTFIHEDYEIGTTIYDIAFNFINDKLINIEFECHNGNRDNDIKFKDLPKLSVSHCASEMDYLLTEKYGSDFKEDIKTKNWEGIIKTTAVTTKKKWITNEKVVDYYYYECNGDCGSKTGGGYGIMSVSFKPQDNIFKIESDIYNSAKDKL